MLDTIQQWNHLSLKFSLWGDFRFLVSMCLCSVMSNFLQPHGLSARLLCPWNFPGKNTGIGCHFLLRWIFQPRDQTHVSCISCIGRQIFYDCTIWEARTFLYWILWFYFESQLYIRFTPVILINIFWSWNIWRVTLTEIYTDLCYTRSTHGWVILHCVYVRHRRIEQSFGLCGRGRGWDDLGEWHWNMYNIIYETSRQSRFDARYWMLGAGALGRPTGMVWGGRREEGSGWGTHVYLWQIHFDIWQNQYSIVKLNIIKFKKKKI